MYVYQALPKNLEVLTDADWAADKESRRSVPCSTERFGQHLLEVSVAKQSVVALSSGEREFYGIVRACAQGIQTQQLLGAVGVPVGLDILSDSSAARGVCNRTGSGKVGHLSIKELGATEAPREGVLPQVRGHALELGGHRPEGARQGTPRLAVRPSASSPRGAQDGGIGAGGADPRGQRDTGGSHRGGTI